MEQELSCLRCGEKMRWMKQEHLFLGQVEVWFGRVYSHADHGFPVEIYGCPKCGKLEFFLGDSPQSEADAGGAIPRIQCPHCGAAYDLDAPKCPECGEKNENW